MQYSSDFNPFAIEQMFAANALCEDFEEDGFTGTAETPIPMQVPRVLTCHKKIALMHDRLVEWEHYTFTGTDQELAEWITATDAALCLPMCDSWREVAQFTWDRLEVIREERLAVRRKRGEMDERFGEHTWQTADLVAEVEAVAGQGKRRGRAMWFNCPLHTGDRSASLEVNNGVWHCFGCGRKGGVYAWRTAVKALR